MRILLATDFHTVQPRNPYVLQLAEELSKAAGVTFVAHGAARLWWPRPAWDVIHFHWPEDLFRGREPTKAELDALDRHLARLRRSTALVATIHNSAPRATFSRRGDRLFRTVYRHCRAFIHLGEASQSFFAARHGERLWFRKAKHFVIPHGEYSFYDGLRAAGPLPPDYWPDGARTKVLVLGAIRATSEAEFARAAFQAAGIENSGLLFAGAVASDIAEGVATALAGSESIRLKGPVANALVRPLLESADAVLIPRFGRLNSGLVPLALTFGIPVVGPREGVIGEMIAASGNATFEPGSVSDCARALKATIGLDAVARETLRRRSDAYREANLRWPPITAAHVMAYRAALPKGRWLRRILPGDKT